MSKEREGSLLNAVSKFANLAHGEKIPGVSSPKHLVEAADTHNYDAIAITDPGAYGWVEADKASEGKDIKYIVAARIPVDFGDQTRYVSVIARNQSGVHKLSNFITKANFAGVSAYDLFAGENNSELFFLVHDDVSLVADLTSQNDTFFGKQFPSQEIPRGVNPEKIVAAPLTLVTSLRQLTTLKFLRSVWGEQTDIPLDDPLVYAIKEASVAHSSYRFPAGTWARAQEIAQDVEGGLPKVAKTKAISVPEGISSIDYLTEITRQTPFYQEKDISFQQEVENELEQIKALGMENSFLIAIEAFNTLTDLEKTATLVTGSAANSSLLATHGLAKVRTPGKLMLRRFISPLKQSVVPDIDITAPPEVLDKIDIYLKTNYPHVAHRAAIIVHFRDGVSEINKDNNLELSASDIEFLQKEDIPNYAYHHMGVIFDPDAPLDHNKKNSFKQRDKEASEGRVDKYDLLNSRGALHVLRTQELMLKDGLSIDLNKHNPEALEFLKWSQHIGIAEADSPHAQKTFRQVAQALGKRFTEEHVDHVLSLMRLPPEARWMYINNAKGHISPLYRHSLLVERLHSTFGVMIHQEDLMWLASTVAGMSAEDEQIFRKLMSEDIPQEVRNYHLDRLANALEKSNFPSKVRSLLIKNVMFFKHYSFTEGHGQSKEKTVLDQSKLAVLAPLYYYASVMESSAQASKQVTYPQQAYPNQINLLGLPWIIPDFEDLTPEFDVRNGAIVLGSLVYKNVNTKRFENNYREFLHIAHSTLPIDVLINYQLEKFGICITHNPIWRYSPKLHFDRQKEKQTIVAMLLQYRSFEDRMLVTLDSGLVIPASIEFDKLRNAPRYIFKNSKDLKIGKFWHIDISPDQDYEGSWKIENVWDEV